MARLVGRIIDGFNVPPCLEQNKRLLTNAVKNFNRGWWIWCTPGIRTANDCGDRRINFCRYSTSCKRCILCNNPDELYTDIMHMDNSDSGRKRKAFVHYVVRKGYKITRPGAEKFASINLVEAVDAAVMEK